MTPADWNTIKILLDEALQLPVDQRDHFLDQACSGKPALRAEVVALLEAYDEAEEEEALSSPFSTFLDLETPEGEAGLERVGPYSIVKLLGRGGMGAVYLAERDDGQFQQTVALKLIRTGLDTKDILSRFSFERQVLAGLDHPNIARLYDGGMSEDGRPYFAMEYIKGLPITEYCDTHRLSTKQRLVLFNTVCRAVQHAHQNLIVHRDLKPSNIIVSEDGVVKLLDFGIAKLIAEEGEGLDASALLTRTGEQVLTPEYAAPEQIRGKAITTATDVYQLGVLLYQLLTGRLPFDLQNKGLYEMSRTILEDEPGKPSTAVLRVGKKTSNEADAVTADAVSQARSTVPSRLRKRLEGDLDIICLTALKKEPGRRYVGPEALSDDIRRHLDGLPVLARPDTFSYRVSKFVQRNRVGVSAVSLALVALIIGFGVAVWQSRIAAQERDLTQHALLQAEGTLSFLESMIVSGGPNEGDPDTPIGVVLDSAAARVEVEFSDQPEVARSVYKSLAGVFFEMGRLDDAEHNARNALQLYETPEGPDYAKAAHVLAMTLGFKDENEESLTYHEAAIQEFTGVPGEEHQLAAVLNTYGGVLLDLANEEEAEAAYNKSLNLYRRINDADIIYPLAGLGLLYNYQGDFESALPLFQEVVDSLRLKHDKPHYVLGESLGNLAATHYELGHIEEALLYREEAIGMLVETVGEEHYSTIISRATYTNELRDSGNVTGAAVVAQHNLEVARRALGPSHSLTAYAENVAGQTYCIAGKPEKGVPMLRSSLETRQSILPEGHWLIANGESLLGGCLAQLGRYDEAEILLTRGYESLKNDRGEDHQRTIEALERLEAFKKY